VKVAQHWAKAFLGIMSYLLIQNPVEVLQNYNANNNTDSSSKPKAMSSCLRLI
jgi:hypothetical protein